MVQLDSDTLTFKPIPEVLSCIAEDRCFTLLGDRSYPQVRPMLQAWETFRSDTNPQPQAVCERNFNRLEEAKDLLYLRGNAGFVGFARGSIDREKIAWFSDRMRSIAEGTWDQWGSEQLTSNLLIANSPHPLPAAVSPLWILLGTSRGGLRQLGVPALYWSTPLLPWPLQEERARGPARSSCKRLNPALEGQADGQGHQHRRDGRLKQVVAGVRRVDTLAG